MAAASTPPSFYTSMAAAKPAGAPDAGGGKDAGANDEAAQAVVKVMSVLGKIPKMVDGSNALVGKAMTALTELYVDVLKKDPKDLDAAGGADKTPPATSEASPAPPTPKPGEAVPA